MLRSLLVVALLITSSVVQSKTKEDGSHVQPDNYYPRVKIDTSMGSFVLELDRARAPITANNFLRYVDKRSYEGTIFHRVIGDFVVQGGGVDTDFREKPKFGTIFNESGNGLKNELYTVSMARENNPHSATRQFFINMNDNPSLDPGRKWGYTVFGTVVEGTETLDAIAQVETEYHAIIGWADVPKQPIVINKATVLPPL